MDIKTYRILQLFMLLMHSLKASCIDVQCDPAEIGTNHSISCSSPVVNDSIIWSRVIKPSPLLIWQCFKNTTCVPFNPFVSPTYNGKMENINSAFRSTLVIYNIRQSPGVIFICSVDGQPAVDVCNPLEFFSKPEGMKCNESLVINEQNMISIVCFLTKVYPAAKMLLNNSDPSKTVTCLNDTSSTVGSIKCQNDIPVAGMKAGINFIDILIYPDVTSGEKFGVKKKLNITLTFPTPSLGQDCLYILTTTQGYIKQGTSANCTCYVKTQGVPPGGVKWFYNNGTEVGSESAVLQVMFAGREANQSYSCVGDSSILGRDSQGIEFIVKNAYGPEQLSLSTSDNQSMYDLCSPNKTIKIICSVPRLSVAPDTIVTISITNGGSLMIYSNHSLTNYIYTSSYRPNSVGELNFRCEALNSIFNELVQAAVYMVYIAGPPSQPPVLTIGQQSYSGNYVKTVEPQREGSAMEITCQASGGFPNTYNMTISCNDSYYNSAASDVVSLSIKQVGRQLNGKQCVCKAQHVTSCYFNNTSNVTLNITFPADLQQFTANSNSSSLTVSNNSDVTFICDTESNPPAVVEIFKTDLVTKSTDYVNFTKKVMCEDSGEYTCKAHNSDFIEPNQSSLVVFVQCSLQLRYAVENYKVFHAQKGKDAVVKFDVLGFPAPVSYSLFKKVQEYEYLITNFSSDSSVKSKYHFEYLLNTLPYGSISVAIFNLTAEDFINYTLSINNSIGMELNISFVLIQGKANVEHTFDILPAAIGGVIGGFAFIFAVILIIMIFKGEILHQYIWKKSKSTRHLQYAEQDHQNSDIYIFKSKNGLGMEINYKNYSDVPITITTATAVPRNFKLKSKPGLIPTYFNSIDDYSNKADKSHLIKKEIKKDGPPSSQARDNSGYENNDSDLYANT